jgi:hypothetical protein
MNSLKPRRVSGPSVGRVRILSGPLMDIAKTCCAVPTRFVAHHGAARLVFFGRQGNASVV